MKNVFWTLGEYGDQATLSSIVMLVLKLVLIMKGLISGQQLIIKTLPNPSSSTVDFILLEKA